MNSYRSSEDTWPAEGPFNLWRATRRTGRGAFASTHLLNRADAKEFVRQPPRGGNPAACLKGHCRPDSAQSSAASVIAQSFSLNLEMKLKLGSDFASLATAHLHFAEWERIRHRAKTYALIFFPDSHPFRQAVDTVCNDLETVRYEAEVSLHRIVRAHGAFRCAINGFFFENPEDDLFKSNKRRYHDEQS